MYNSKTPEFEEDTNDLIRMVKKTNLHTRLINLSELIRIREHAIDLDYNEECVTTILTSQIINQLEMAIEEVERL